MHNVLGGTIDPHASYLLLRGMKTLDLRVQRHNSTALLLAQVGAELGGWRGGRATCRLGELLAGREEGLSVVRAPQKRQGELRGGRHWARAVRGAAV